MDIGLESSVGMPRNFGLIGDLLINLACCVLCCMATLDLVYLVHVVERGELSAGGLRFGTSRRLSHCDWHFSQPVSSHLGT